MKRLFRNRYLFALDLLGWLVLPPLVLALMWDGFGEFDRVAAQLVFYILLAGFIKFSFVLGLGLYRRFWEYASIDETLLIGLAALGSGLVTVTVYFGVVKLGRVPAEAALPISLPIVDMVFTLVYLGAIRLAPRCMARLRRKDNGAERILIVGAGVSGSMIAKELLTVRSPKFFPVGFIDDDPAKLGRPIHGLPVLGRRHDIPVVAKSWGVKRVVIAMPSAPGKAIREISDICHKAQLETKTLPGLSAMISGNLSVSQIRDVQIQDLLRRAPVRTDQTSIGNLLEGEVVLVTGAGGSIGREICRQVARFGVRKLILLGHGENSIFEVFNGLKRSVSGIELVPVIADIRHPERIHAVFRELKPSIVFHAAAHKHVPLMQLNPAEAITNNVGGTLNVVEAAEAVGVERFVFISTDKAVKPVNIMGATKLISELIVHDAAVRSGQAFVSVRFGNVLGSRGSVVPIFQRQIMAGGPVTVTHKDMTRYFMTIPEAVQLVLQAAALGNGGESFVLDMGEPVRIEDLAHDLIRLSGLRVGEDIDIVYTGLRPGEKLTEELFTESEAPKRSSHDKIMISGNGRPKIRLDQVKNLVGAAEVEDLATCGSILRELLNRCDTVEQLEEGLYKWGKRGWEGTGSRPSDIRTIAG